VHAVGLNVITEHPQFLGAHQREQIRGRVDLYDLTPALLRSRAGRHIAVTGLRGCAKVPSFRPDVWPTRIFFIQNFLNKKAARAALGYECCRGAAR
jgi:hypothetical protein